MKSGIPAVCIHVYMKVYYGQALAYLRSVTVAVRENAASECGLYKVREELLEVTD